MSTTVYPDTADGFLAMLNADSMLTLRRADCRVIEADPQVAGVWRLELLKPQHGVVEVIGYLAGYPDPFGRTRTDNDFEKGYA